MLNNHSHIKNKYTNVLDLHDVIPRAEQNIIDLRGQARTRRAKYERMLTQAKEAHRQKQLLSFARAYGNASKMHKRVSLKSLAAKSMAILVIISLNLTGLSQIGSTLSIFNDTETSTGNVFASGLIDYTLTVSPFNNDNWNNLIPGTTTAQDVDVLPGLSNPFFYYASSTNFTGDGNFCNAIQLTASLQNVVMYVGPLVDFLSPTTTVIDAWTLEFSNNSPFFNSVCTFDIDWNGWQTRHSYPEYDDAYSDTERTTHTLFSDGLKINKVYFEEPCEEDDGHDGGGEHQSILSGGPHHDDDDDCDDGEDTVLVSICHATESETNPWVELSINLNGFNGHFFNNGTPKAGHEDDYILGEGEHCPNGDHEEHGLIIENNNESNTENNVTVESEGGDASSTVTVTNTINTNIFGNGDSHKITICHATESETNPYVRIVVDENATNGHFDENGTPLAGHEEDFLFDGIHDCPKGDDRVGGKDIEWVELYNPNNQPADIDGWKICDAQECDVMDPSGPIPPHGFAIIVPDESVFDLWQVPDDFVRIVMADGTIGDGLDNENDALFLRRPDLVTFDQVNWGIPDALWPNFVPSLWNPGVPVPPLGEMIARVPTGFDTNLPTDWFTLGKPTIDLLYPGDVVLNKWYWGYVYVVSWEATNVNGPDEDLLIDIVLIQDSNHNGKIDDSDERIVLEDNTPNDGEEEVTNPEGFCGKIWIRIIATGPENPMVHAWDTSGKIDDPIPPELLDDADKQELIIEAVSEQLLLEGESEFAFVLSDEQVAEIEEAQEATQELGDTSEEVGEETSTTTEEVAAEVVTEEATTTEEVVAEETDTTTEEVVIEEEPASETPVETNEAPVVEEETAKAEDVPAVEETPSEPETI